MATPSELNQLYLAYFGRPADASGLAFYASMPLTQVIASFSASPESRVLYGNTFGPAQITQVYSNLFNRPADPDAVTAWAAVLASGSVSPAALALTILRSAQNDDKAPVANKLSFTEQWTASFQLQANTTGATSASAYALAKTLLAGVGASPASLTNTVAATSDAITALGRPAATPPPEPDPSPAPPTPQTFTLTTAAETITGGAADDTINGSAVYNGVNEQNTSTFNALTDSIDGGAGTDTLTLALSGSSNPNITIYPAQVKNVERLSITSATTGTTLTLGTSSSFTELLSSANTTLTFTGYGNNVTKIGVTGQTTGTLNFTPNATALTGTSDALTITLTNNGSTSTNAAIKLDTAGTDYYETLNIVSAGTANYVRLSTGATQTALATINISGSAPLTLAPTTVGGDRLYATPTIDASAATGGVTIGAGTGTTGMGLANQTIKLGSGNDTVYFAGTGTVGNVTSNLDANDTVDGGGGTDRLVVIATNGIASAALAHVTNFEVFGANPNGATITQDASQLTGKFTSIALTSSGATTLTNLPSDNSMPLLVDANLSSLVVTAQLANNGAGGSDALTLRMVGATTTGASLSNLSAITGLETLNVFSSGSGTQNNLTSAVVANYVITGSINLSVVASNAAGNISVNATAFTGRLDFSGPTTNTYGLTLQLGAAPVDGTANGGFGTNLFTLGVAGSNTASYQLLSLRATATANTVQLFGNTTTGNGGATGYLGTDIKAVDIRDGSANVGNITLVFSANDNDFGLKNAAGTLSTGLARGTTAKGLGAGDTIVTQNVAKDATAAALTANVTHIALTTAANFTTDIKGTFAAAMGTASITGLAADANYLISMFDSTSLNNHTLYAVVNTGASGAGDTTLSAADFTNGGVAVIGVVLDGSLGAGISFGTAL